MGWYVEFFDFEGCRAKKGFSVRFCRKNCPIFTFDMSLERYSKHSWDGMSIFLVLKAVGQKRGFQCLLWLCRKNCPI